LYKSTGCVYFPKYPWLMLLSFWTVNRAIKAPRDRVRVQFHRHRIIDAVDSWNDASCVVKCRHNFAVTFVFGMNPAINYILAKYGQMQLLWRLISCTVYVSGSNPLKPKLI
jgi:hypothetical protein